LSASTIDKNFDLLDILNQLFSRAKFQKPTGKIPPAIQG